MILVRSDEEKITKNLDDFERWVLNPIRDIVYHTDKRKNHFHAFTLIAVAIDNLSNMRYSLSMKDKGKSKRFINFIKDYFPITYSKIGNNMYHDFRCEMIHNFKIRRFDIRQDSKYQHLEKVKGKYVLQSKQMFFGVIR